MPLPERLIRGHDWTPNLDKLSWPRLLQTAIEVWQRDRYYLVLFPTRFWILFTQLEPPILLGRLRARRRIERGNVPAAWARTLLREYG